MRNLLIVAIGCRLHGVSFFNLEVDRTVPGAVRLKADFSLEVLDGR